MPSTYLVFNTADNGLGSLRQALLDANAHSGADQIHFNIPGAGVHTINLLSALPAITDAVTLDGTTQPGYSHSPLIELNGTATPAGTTGVALKAANTTVRGLVIDRFSGNGITIQGPGGDHVEGNYIGTNAAGTAALANGLDGVFVNGSPNNVIGGTASGAGNLISGNGEHGVVLVGSGATGNHVQGNRIGTDVTGRLALGNTQAGVLITDGTFESQPHTSGGASHDLVGGTAGGAGNLISANKTNGVVIAGTGSDHNRVQGNFIGTDVTGTLALGNGLSLQAGLAIVSGPQSNTIGGSSAAARNIISGNSGDGVLLRLTSNNTVRNNYVGSDVTGRHALGNGLQGVGVEKSANNLFALNLVSGNANNGIALFGGGSSSNTVQHNYVGTDVTGQVAIPNAFSGVVVTDGANFVPPVTGMATHNVIQSNVISGNAFDGIQIRGPVVTGTGYPSISSFNRVQNNVIGETAPGPLGGGSPTGGPGPQPLGNGRHGVTVDAGASDNVILQNTIAHNTAIGVRVGLPVPQPGNRGPTTRSAM